MATLNFDASSVPPAQPFDIIPAGKYIAMVVQSEMRATKSGDGQYLWLELDIIDGACSGRKVWDRLNLVNGNQQAVDIAKRALSALAHACGKAFVRDSAELHNIPVQVTVRVRPGKDGCDPSNEVRGYAPLNGAAPAPAQPTVAAVGQVTMPQQSAPAPAPAPTRAAPPWRKTA